MAQATSTDPHARLSIRDLKGDTRRLRRERTVRLLFMGAAGLSILISAAIIFSLFRDAIGFLTQIEVGDLWRGGWFPRRGQFNIPTVVVGSLIVSMVAMIVATPLGLGAAIYLSEYAKPALRRKLKPILEMLAGIPSVVMGFFALTVISPGLIQRLFSDASLFNMAAAGIGVGILVTPLVASVAEDAMYAVPLSMREASYGLGAKRATTSMRVVFPAAISGIMAALILGVSRAIGETMVVAIAAGGTGGSAFTTNVLGPGQSMTAAMTALATGSDQVSGNTAAFNSLFFLGLLLFFMTFALNLVSERFVRRVRKRF